MFSSVRFRLTCWYMLSFGILLIVFSVVNYVIIAKRTYKQLDDLLLESTIITTNALKDELGENKSDFDKTIAEIINTPSLSTIELVIFKQDKVIATTYPNIEQSSSQIISLAKKNSLPVLTYIDGFGQEGARVAISSLTIDSQDYLIVSIKSLQDIVQQLQTLRIIFYISLPSVLLLSGLGGYFLANKNLLSVRAISTQARQINANNLHERLTVKNEKDEFGQLALLFNDLLCRLEKSFISMRQFMADASHELRTPLAIIKGETEIALSQERSIEYYQNSLTIINEETKQLSNIVSDLLVLARADAGQDQINMEHFYLDDLVRECYKAIQVLANNRQVSIKLTTEDDFDFYGDENLIKRLFLNLLENAVKYNVEGGFVTILVSKEPLLAKVSITDTGIGIDKNSLEKIFDRFYRVDKARSRADGSSGLGLAIAKCIAEAHQGTIEVTSEIGVGSSFTVFLPLKNSEQ